MASIYKELIPSKTGPLIPVLLSGKTFESRYNPEADAERKAANLPESNFFLQFGLGSGILTQKILKRFPEAVFLIIERNNDDFEFLENLENVKELKKNKNIHFAVSSDLREKLIDLYIPALYGNFQIIEQTSFFLENEESGKIIKNEFESALGEIKKDYSVQAHFGKLWQSNILKNLRHQGKENLNLDLNKTAVVLAAGPSLDSKINILSESRKNYFIISTDTAYSVLRKNQIKPDIVVSIDGQSVSNNHFFVSPDEDTAFIFDLCGNSSAYRKMALKSPVIGVRTGHPLSGFLTPDSRALYTGAGTVTIAALDFAITSGFKNIEVWGADFSYPGNKPYCKGTYLDSLYNMGSNRISSSEKNFSNLMFRVPLQREENTPTTEVLCSYRKSFEEYLKTKNVVFEKKQNVYVIQNNYENIRKDYSINYVHVKEKLDHLTNLKPNDGNIMVFLPYIAYMRRKNPDMSFEEYLEMSKLKISGFKSRYEEK